MKVTGPSVVLRHRFRSHSELLLPGSTNTQQAVLYRKAYSSALWAHQNSSLARKKVVPLLQYACIGQPCFLQGGNVDIQSLELVIDDSCFPGVADVLEVLRKARHHCLDIQHPSFRAGLFFDVFLLLLPGVVVDDLLLRCSPNLHAPNEESRPWQDNTLLTGGCQLEAGGSCPMRHEDLSHHRKQPLALHSTPIEWWLITGICCFLCWVNTT